MIPKDFIDSLLAKLDIATDVIGIELNLKKQGNNYSCNCPFHNEKTASFVVNTDKQFYHCFGCKASGDAIKFLVEYKGLSFVEAVESLAKQLNMTVPNSGTGKINDFEIEYNILELATNFFNKQLLVSNSCKKFIQSRGLSSYVVERYRIGYAPNSWQQLLEYFNSLIASKQLQLEAKDVLEEKLCAVGLIAKNDKTQRYYSKFRNRLIFPIASNSGKILGFGGRVINADDKPKYLNSAESKIFHKSNILYGLFQYLRSGNKSDHFLIVEGYMDVCALAKDSINNAVATMGTAVTESHLLLLFRYQSKLVFCFDGDTAGQKAAIKALELSLPLLEDGRIIRFLVLPEGKDPDDIIKDDGKDGFLQLVEQALNLDSFLLQTASRGLSFDSSDEKSSILSNSLQLIAKVPSYLIREGLLSYLATKIGITLSTLENSLQKYLNIAKENLNKAKLKRQYSSDFIEAGLAANTGSGAYQANSNKLKSVATKININTRNSFNWLLYILIKQPRLYEEYRQQLDFDNKIFNLTKNQQYLVADFNNAFDYAKNNDFDTPELFIDVCQSKTYLGKVAAAFENKKIYRDVVKEKLQAKEELKNILKKFKNKYQLKILTTQIKELTSKQSLTTAEQLQQLYSQKKAIRNGKVIKRPLHKNHLVKMR